MENTADNRDHALELPAARELRTRHSQQYDAARGSPRELPAFTELQAAEEQLAAREVWLAWINRGC